MILHKDLIKYCYASYSGNEESFKNTLSISSKVDSYFGDSLHKYTVELDNCYVIVFRGSVNKFDWLNNFTFNAVDFSHTNVHQGFFSAFEAEAKPRLSYDKPVYITGHSLGGAIAILEAYRLYSYNLDIREVVLFGSPMVGALSFKEKYEKYLGDKTTRYVNGNDIVPSLPPLRYQQVGKLISIGKKSSWLNPFKYVNIINDHKIENYVNAMGKI